MKSKSTLIIDEPLGAISAAEAAALTLIRGVEPKERAEALEWFKKRAESRVLRQEVIQAMEQFINENKTGSAKPTKVVVKKKASPKKAPKRAPSRAAKKKVAGRKIAQKS